MNSKYNKEIQYSIIKKYFEDKASDEEKKLVNNWLNNPESAYRYESFLRLLWKETDSDARQTSIDLNLLLDKIHHTINLKSGKEKIRRLPVRSKQVVSFTHVLKNIARVAAILLLPLMGYIGWKMYSQEMWVNNQTEIVYNEIICPLGARSQFVLPDGTRGNLNNGSRLKYPVKFHGDTREVQLVGEAFFDVYQDKNRPFIIKTVGLDVKVLGTKLNVYSYPGESYQEFTLESGTVELIKKENNKEISIVSMKPGQHVIYRFEEDKIDMEAENSDIESTTITDKEELEEFVSKMKNGQRAIYEMKKGKMDIKYDETYYYSAWKDGKLVLRNDPMPNLLKRIERWYNVKFNVLDEGINEYTYWATFEEENLDQVLKLLSLTGPIKFEKHPREQLADGTYKAQEIDVMLRK
jgi:transmembrane sensor